MALYFYFNETTGDLVYSNQATYDVEGYTSLGEQIAHFPNPTSPSSWVFHSYRSMIKTVSKDPATVNKCTGLTRMSYMFTDCNSLVSLDLSGLDMSEVTEMSHLFERCRLLTSLDLSSFNTSKVTSITNMFYNCSSIVSLDLSNFDTSKVTTAYNMFEGCSSLVSLDLSSFDTSQIRNTSTIFTGCTSLRLITISDKMSNILSTLPADQYYPAAGGGPVAKANLTAGTWVRDEADLTMVTSIVQQAQMQQTLSHRINDLKKNLEAQIKEANTLLNQLSFATGGIIPIENGGTNATSASEALTALGAASASDLQSVQDSVSRGEVIVPAGPGETVSYRVSFPRPMGSVPTVMATIVSTVPERFFPPCVNNIDESGFSLYVQRSTDSATRVAWLAVL